MLDHILLPSGASLNYIQLSALLLSVLASYLFLRTFYFLYFHPLSSFPGPRRAAISTWWLYFVSNSGRAEQTFEQLHRKYKTRVLRISPNELHISDSTVYHTIYSQDHAFLKHDYFYEAFLTPHSVSEETDPILHRQRRKMLNNFFSKSSIRRMQHLIYDKVEKLCTVLSENSGKGPLNIHNAVRCMTVDIISDLAFGDSFNEMDKAQATDFHTDFLSAFDLVVYSIWDLMYFPRLRSALTMLPSTISILLGGPRGHFARLSEIIHVALTRFRKVKDAGKDLEHDVIFDGLSSLDDKLMLSEAITVLIAGSDTTATTLAVGIYQLACNPEAYKALKSEIQRANLKTVQDYDLKSIEQLPYLAACVKESLRFATPVPGRLPRITPTPKPGATALTVDDKVIPPGTVVSVSAYTVHNDEKIWGADAREFNPKRWLAPEAKELDRYLVPFSKGARQCLGINLAYAELTLAFAMFMARFDFAPDGVKEKWNSDTFDGFTIGFRGSGVRVNVSAS